MKVRALHNFKDFNTYITTYNNPIIKGQIIDVSEPIYDFLNKRGLVELLEKPKEEEVISCEIDDLQNQKETTEVKNNVVEEVQEKKTRKKKAKNEHQNDN